MRLPACLLLSTLCLPATAAESVYTKSDFDKDCKVVEEDEYGGVTALCQGYGGYQIHFAEGDLRQSVFYGFVGTWHEAGAFETFGPFNHVAPTVEWRIENGRPFATIRRWFVSAGEDAKGKPKPDIQVLVISRVAQKADGEGCVVGYVEATANPNANEIARQVADNDARDFACRYAEAQWRGKRSSEDVTASSQFEERPPE